MPVSFSNCMKSHLDFADSFVFIQHFHTFPSKKRNKSELRNPNQTKLEDVYMDVSKKGGIFPQKMDGENNGSKPYDDFGGVFPYFFPIFLGWKHPSPKIQPTRRFRRLQHPTDTEAPVGAFGSTSTCDLAMPYLWHPGSTSSHGLGHLELLSFRPVGVRKVSGISWFFVSDLLKRMGGNPRNFPNFFGGKWFNFVGNTLEGRKGLQI